MDPTTLQAELIDLLILIQNLTPMQLKSLLSFVENHAPESLLPQLYAALRSASPEQVSELVGLTSNSLEHSQAAAAEKSVHTLATEMGMNYKDVLESFNTLFQLYHLQGLMQSLSILQLMKLFEIMPPGPTVQQRQLLEQIQQLLSQIQPEALANLHKEMEQAQPGTEQQTLSQILNLPLNHFQLYQPLRSLLQLDLEELLKLQEELPRLTPYQCNQLLQMLQMQPYDVLEVRNLMNPSFEFSSDFMADTEKAESSSVTPPPPPTQVTENKKIGLQIVEQPPEKSVYKRNLKPNPMVMVVGDQKLSGNLVVTVTLVRCDNWQEEPKFLTGNKPERVSSGRMVTFRKLKVTTTSHQQQETLFCLKFELRRHIGDDEYEVLDSLMSNPINVLSHSTQMKPVPSAAPSITEVVPAVGPPVGGTRVAVLGNNFVDTPAARIRFDTTDVMPTFHGPGTLICHTPQHQPGQVSVRVCNSAKKWSETSATFTYDSSLETFKDPMYDSLLARQNYDATLNEAAWQGNFDAVKRLQENGSNINAIDHRGYAPIHYACANSYAELCTFLLEKGADPNIRDKIRGGTPLFWASVLGLEEVAQLLADHGAHVDAPDFNGVTPLMAAVLSGNDKVANLLMENGASPNLPALSGETPLHIAAAAGRSDIVLQLIQFGAFLNAVDDEGDTALHYSIRESQDSVVDLLVNRGVDINATNFDEETPVHLAVHLQEFKIVTILLQSGAVVNTQDAAGTTPLHDAVAYGDAKVVMSLLTNGGEPNVRDLNGDTPLHRALRNALQKVQDGHQMATFLLSAGGDMNVKNRQGQTPQDLAHSSRFQVDSQDYVEIPPALKRAKSEKFHSGVDEKQLAQLNFPWKKHPFADTAIASI